MQWHHVDPTTKWKADICVEIISQDRNAEKISEKRDREIVYYQEI